MDVRRQWEHTVRALKENTINQQFVSGKTILQEVGRNLNSLNKQKLRKSVTGRHALQQMSKGALEAEMKRCRTVT